jgi:GNAT superfamily N-acetyltransferase
MSDIRIIEVKDQGRMREFVELPHEVHRGHPLWVPPLRSQERDLLTPGKHPFWEEAEGALFLALRGDTPVGRIAALADRKANAYAQQIIGAWGFFECRDDMPAAHALFDAVHDWHKARNAHFLRGPLNPSTNYTCGMLVDGFEKAPSIMMPWNPAYYPRLAEAWNMRKERDMFAYICTRKVLDTSEWINKERALVKERAEFSVRLSSRATLEADIALMLEIYGASWADNWGFCPISKSEVASLVAELKSVLDPGLFALFHHNGEPAGGMLALPNLNPLLKALNGSIGLGAPWHWLRTRSEVAKGFRMLLFGVKPQYRLMGLPFFVMEELFDLARRRPALQWMEASWTLEDNDHINQMIEDFGGVLDKRYRIYRREMKNG